jgi:hypothetical protein
MNKKEVPHVQIIPYPDVSAGPGGNIRKDCRNAPEPCKKAKAFGYSQLEWINNRKSVISRRLFLVTRPASINLRDVQYKANMNHIKTSFYRATILFVTLIMLASPTMQASAALHKCRSDPMFFLSNGEILTVILEIGTDKAGVRDVHYVLHLPTGVRVLRVVYTSGGVGESETYEIIQDTPKSVYTTETRVNTYENGVPVKVISHLRTTREFSASGYNGDLLIITLAQNNQSLNNSTLELKAPEK